MAAMTHNANAQMMPPASQSSGPPSGSDLRSLQNAVMAPRSNDSDSSSSPPLEQPQAFPMSVNDVAQTPIHYSGERIDSYSWSPRRVANDAIHSFMSEWETKSWEYPCMSPTIIQWF